jgi:hypothetical protein
MSNLPAKRFQFHPLEFAHREAPFSEDESGSTLQ